MRDESDQVMPAIDEADVQHILAFDETMIGSDGIPHGTKPHPRLWGTFPRVLGHYSRALGLFPLETAVWKMSGLPARNFGLADRGMLAPGQAADRVMVNGAVAWRAGAATGARSGQVLKRTPRRGAPR
ncbi:MAG: amidohydrolase family protein [Rubrivivax sp.]|nr:amidohydrolase family protein [Rubrivivax sp.]